MATSPDDVFDIEVMPSQIKYSRMMFARSDQGQSESTASQAADLASRQLRIRYPEGQTTLAYNRSEGGGTALLFRGKFRDWFRANLTEGDRIWLRLHVGDTVEFDELEIRLAETKVIEEPGDNYLVVPVRPDWVDNRGLLGYFNPLTDQYSTTPFLDLLIRAKSEKERADSVGEDPYPFFVILDEMNLARVEHYFSDFLSAVESGEPIPLHDNEAVEQGRRTADTEAAGGAS